MCWLLHITTYFELSIIATLGNGDIYCSVDRETAEKCQAHFLMRGHVRIQTNPKPVLSSSWRTPRIMIAKMYLCTQTIPAVWCYGNIYIISSGCALKYQGLWALRKIQQT